MNANQGHEDLTRPSRTNEIMVKVKVTQKGKEREERIQSTL
jgi:hypothetical protein